MIPKTMYFYWGNDRLSWLRYMSIYSFRKLNPDWKVYLYYSRPFYKKEKTWNSIVEQDFFNYTNKKNYLNEVNKLNVRVVQWDLQNPEKPADLNWNYIGPSHKSNFFKWQTLSVKGGFYSDLDILYIKPMDDLYEKIKDFNTGICYTTIFSIGFLASSSANQIYYTLFKEAFKRYTQDRYQCVGVETLYNLLMGNDMWEEDGSINWNYIHKVPLLKLLHEKFPSSKIYNFPMDLVYPFKYNEPWMMFQRPPEESLPRIKDDTIGIHWFAGDPVSQEYNNKLDHVNYKGFNNIITYFSEKI